MQLVQAVVGMKVSCWENIFFRAFLFWFQIISFFYFYLSLSFLCTSVSLLSMAFLPFAFTSSFFLISFISFLPRSFIYSSDFLSSLILRFLSSIVLFLFCCLFFVALFVNFSCFLFPRAFFSYFLSFPPPANLCTHFNGVMKSVFCKAFRPLVWDGSHLVTKYGTGNRSRPGLFIFLYII